MKIVNRVRSNKDFTLTIKNGKHFNVPTFHFVSKENDLDRFRVGISVSKKLGNAVVRNKIKRQIRAMCDGVIDFSKGYDLIIIVKNEYLNNDYHSNLGVLSDYISNKLGVNKWKKEPR